MYAGKLYRIRPTENAGDLLGFSYGGDNNNFMVGSHGPYNTHASVTLDPDNDLDLHLSYAPIKVALSYAVTPGDWEGDDNYEAIATDVRVNNTVPLANKDSATRPGYHLLGWTVYKYYTMDTSTHTPTFYTAANAPVGALEISRASGEYAIDIYKALAKATNTYLATQKFMRVGFYADDATLAQLYGATPTADVENNMFTMPAENTTLYAVTMADDEGLYLVGFDEEAGEEDLDEDGEYEEF